MTDDVSSPTAPDLRSEEDSWQERIRHAINDEAPVWEEQFNAGPGIVCSVSDASVVAARLVAPELERLAAEVERLRTQVGDQCDEYNAMVKELWSKVHDARTERDEWKQAAGAEADLLDQVNVEVSRLREQLATAVVLPQDVAEQAAIWLFRAKTSRLKPEAADYARRAWEHVLDEFDQEAWLHYAKAMLADLGWGVSSSEAEAPQPAVMTQHRVNIDRARWDARVSFAACRDCSEKCCGDTPDVEFWKDEHEADTLRPQLQADSKLEQNLDEGRPSGSKAAEPHPMETGQVLVSRSELVAGMLVGIGGEHDAVPTQQQLDRAADLIIRSARRRDSTEEGRARLLAVLFDRQCAETGCTDTAVDGDVVCSQHLAPDESEQDAASAARSEATPKWVCVGDSHDADLGEPCPKCKPYATSPIGKLMDRIGASPSPRKEGEDRG